MLKSCKMKTLKEREYLFPFEKLEVWQLAKELTLAIYNVSKRFPANEQYGLISQINRAVISVASNLAEGSSRIINALCRSRKETSKK